MTDFIDDIMGFDPSNLSAFQEPVNANSFDANVYKTNPVKLSKAEDGHYRSRVRVLYNPFNVKRSIVPQATYFIQDSEGSLLVRSKLGNGDKTCPSLHLGRSFGFQEMRIRRTGQRQCMTRLSLSGY